MAADSVGWGLAGGTAGQQRPCRHLLRCGPSAGMSSGMVLVFDIPPKGTNITVSEVLKEHHDAITDIAAELGRAPVCVWLPAAAGAKVCHEGEGEGGGCSCPLALWLPGAILTRGTVASLASPLPAACRQHFVGG